MPVPVNNSAKSESTASGVEPDTAALPPLPRVRIRTRPCREVSSQHANAPGPDAGGTDYEVGYRKPPRSSQFQPGQSGNPRGRPKVAKGLMTLVRETMTAQITVRTARGDTKMSRIEVVLQKMVELAMKGDQRALKQLISLYGSAVPEAEPRVADAALNEFISTLDFSLQAKLDAELWDGMDD